MNAKVLALRSVGALALLALAQTTVAQAQPAPARPATAAPRPAVAAPAGPQIAFGPPIAGMCVVNMDGVAQSSTLGGAVLTRLQQLAQQVDAELKPEAQAIATENTQLEAQ